MAEIIRIAESTPQPGTQALPQNIEAEAALLGALMIDNRLVEDVQLKLRPDHFFEPLHARIYEAVLRMTDANRVANPVTLRPLFESDEVDKRGWRRPIFGAIDGIGRGRDRGKGLRPTDL